MTTSDQLDASLALIARLEDELKAAGEAQARSRADRQAVALAAFEGDDEPLPPELPASAYREVA